jgi:hypothetical protein
MGMAAFASWQQVVRLLAASTAGPSFVRRVRVVRAAESGLQIDVTHSALRSSSFNKGTFRCCRSSSVVLSSFFVTGGGGSTYEVVVPPSLHGTINSLSSWVGVAVGVDVAVVSCTRDLFRWICFVWLRESLIFLSSFVARQQHEV